MRLFEKIGATPSEDPGLSDGETDASKDTSQDLLIRSHEGGGWASLLFESPDETERRLKENVREALNLIEKTLSLGQRKEAVRFWLMARGFRNLKDTKSALYEEAGQDKAEYYRWERGKLPDGSQADRDIRRVLRSIIE
jgi:hypothetical protein